TVHTSPPFAVVDAALLALAYAGPAVQRCSAPHGSSPPGPVAPGNALPAGTFPLQAHPSCGKRLRVRKGEVTRFLQDFSKISPRRMERPCSPSPNYGLAPFRWTQETRAYGGKNKSSNSRPKRLLCCVV